MAKIGVVVPFYDDYQYLESMLKSVGRSSRQHQVIVVIGLDTVKRTPANVAAMEVALQNYADLDIRIVENFRGGPCKARNDGVRSLLESDPDIEFFFFLDADNFFGDEALDRLVETLQQSPEPAHFTYQDMIFFEADRKLVKLDVPFNNYRHLYHFYGDTGNLVRAEVFKNGDFFDDSEWYATGEDIEFYRRIGSKYRGVYCETSDFYYRVKNVSRVKLYWEGQAEFDSVLRTRLKDQYEAAEARFNQQDWFDFLSVSDSIEDYFKVDGFDPLKSARSIFDMKKGALMIGADRPTLYKILSSQLGPVVQSQLFNADAGKIFFFKITGEAAHFSYDLRVVRWLELDQTTTFTFAILPHNIVRDHGSNIAAGVSDVEVVEIHIHWPGSLVVDNVRMKGVRQLLQRLISRDQERLDLVRKRLHGLAGSPVKAEIGPIYSTDARTPWLLDRHSSRPEVFNPHAYWDFTTRQKSESYFGATRSRNRPSKRKGLRFLIATSFLGVGGVSAGMIDFIREFRRRNPEALIDLLISHFERSDQGSPQSKNNYKIGDVLADIDGVLFGDFIDEAGISLFLTATLLAYDVVQLETAFPPYGVLDDVKRASKPPKIISHLYCWDYFHKTRAGFPVYVTQRSHVIDAYSSQTRLVADYLVSREVHPSKVNHIPYSSRLSFERAALVKRRHQRIGTTDYKPVIYWSGRWGEQKDPELLLQVLSLFFANPGYFRGRFVIHALNEYNNETRFYGAAAEQLAGLAASNPDRLEVIWEEVDDRRLTELYTEADILFSTSRWEGIAFVMYEALAAGALVVATNISANTELAEQYGVRVRLSEGREPAELARMLSQAASDVLAGDALAAFNETVEGPSFAERQIELIERLHNGELDKIEGYRGDSAAARIRAFSIELNELRLGFEGVGIDLDSIVERILGAPIDLAKNLWTAELIDQLRDILQRLMGLPLAAMSWFAPFLTDGTMARSTGRLRGCLDTFQFGADRFQIAGWVFDPEAKAPPKQVVIITRTRVLGPMAPFVLRPDVGLSSQALGFGIDEPWSLQEQEDDVLVLGITVDGKVDRIEPLFSVSGGVVRWWGALIPIASGKFGFVDRWQVRPASWPSRPDHIFVAEGWACDEASGEPARTLVLADHRGFATVSPNILRPDIQNWLGDRAANCGFKVELKSYLPDRPRVFAFFSNHCAELSLFDTSDASDAEIDMADLIERAKPAEGLVNFPTAISEIAIAPAKKANRFTFVFDDIDKDEESRPIGPLFAYVKSLADAGQAIEVLLARDIPPQDLQRRRRAFTAAGVTLFALNDVPDPPFHIYGFRPHYRRSWRIMRWLRERPSSVIVFQDAGGVGFWTIRAKQLGMAFDTKRLMVLASAPLSWRRQTAKTFGERVVDEDDEAWCERAAIEGADLVVASGQNIADWLRAESFEIARDVIISPHFFVEAALPVTVDVNPSHLIFLGELDSSTGFGLLVGALRHLSQKGGLTISRITLLGSFGKVGSEGAEQVITDLRAELPSVAIDVRKAFSLRNAFQFIRDTGGVLVIASNMEPTLAGPIAAISESLFFIAPSEPATQVNCADAVLFKPTISGLADVIARLGRIDFNSLRHPYKADEACRQWLETMLGSSQSAPAILRAPDEDEPAPISVCIPFYRHDRYVPRLVRAFLGMGLPQLQLVIVDDGTPAEERIELDKVRDRLELLGHIVHSQPNAGPGAARNKALELAQHEHLLFFDSDNVPFKNMVRDLWRAMARAKADSVSAPFAAVPPMTSMPSESDVLYHFHPPGGSLTLSLFDNMVGDMTSLIRRQALEGVKGFHTRIAEPAWEDWELFFRLSGNSYRHFVYPEPLLYYTDHPNREKSREQLYDVRASLIAQLEDIDRPALVRIAKVLAAHSLTLRDRGAW